MSEGVVVSYIYLYLSTVPRSICMDRLFQSHAAPHAETTVVDLSS